MASSATAVAVEYAAAPGVVLTMEIEGNAGQTGLPRTLTLINGISLVVGTIIGSGIFASPGVVAGHAGSAGMALMVWLLSGLLAFAGSLSYAELGAAIPASGGEVIYLDRAFGSLVSFLFTWTNAVVTRPAALGIICLVCGENACRVWFSSETQCHSSASLTKTLALICVGLVAVINSVSVRAATVSLTVLTSFKLFALFIVGSAGLIVALKGNAEPTLGSHSFDGTSARVLDYPLAFLAALWAFDGWNNLNYAAEEMVDPKHFAKVLQWSVPLVTFLYLLVNVAYFIVLPLDVVKETASIGVDLGVQVAGASAGRILMPICVSLVAFGAALGTLFSSSRLVYASARSGWLPSCFGVVSAYCQTPVRAIIGQASVAALALVVGDFENLVSYFGSASWLFYFLTVAGLLRLRWLEPNLPRPYRVPTLAPVAFCLVAAMLVATELLSNPATSLAAFGFVACGVPVFFLRRFGVFQCGWCSFERANVVVAGASREEVPPDHEALLGN